MYPSHIKKLIAHFSKLPGVGPKTAGKYVFALINWNKYAITEFTRDIEALGDHIIHCEQCFNYSNGQQCSICLDKKRDPGIVCVVTSYPDLLSIELLDEYKGTYHILQGAINPIDGITPDQLTIDRLIKRVEEGVIQEIILALNPDIPGETTALYLKNILEKYPVNITRIAKGLPMGATLEYSDQTTISNALKGRTKL